MTRVLIVDDSLLIHKLMKKILDKLGYAIVGNAKNGKEAIELFKDQKPDITFMDITMPIMSGIEAAKEIKSLDQSANIVMLTSITDDIIMQEAKTLGINIFLSKPFDEAKISTAIKETLGKV